MINKRLVLKQEELAFLIYFLPLFFLKMLDITADNILLKLAGIGCFAMYGLYMFKFKYSPRLVQLFSCLFIYSAILVLTCGKQGVFFSIVMLLAMKNIKMDNRIYKICFIVGIIALIVACYIGRHGTETTRFVNGEWVTMYKRSNLLYVSYMAVVCLFLLIQRNRLNNKHIIAIGAISYLVYLYVGSRTGLVSAFFLILLLLLFRNRNVWNRKIIKYACVLSPLLCFAFSYITGLCYEKHELFSLLDLMFQGRIYQNNAYLNRYDITLFGQHIYEGSENGEFWCLDCAYMDMLICLGLIFTILWIVISTKVIKYMYDNNKKTEVAIMIMYALYGISETFLINCFLNMSLFLYGEYLYAQYNLIAEKFNYEKRHSVKSVNSQ